MELVGLGKLTDRDEIEAVWKLIQRHQTYTRSERAAKILADWNAYVPKFVKVLPKDYARVLEELKKAEAQGLTGDEAIMAAFEANIRDVARVGGG
jgi:glutamate synthase (ferredoxin)